MNNVDFGEEDDDRVSQLAKTPTSARLRSSSLIHNSLFDDDASPRSSDQSDVRDVNLADLEAFGPGSQSASRVCVIL